MTKIPTNTSRARRGGAEGRRSSATSVWGYNVPMTDKDFTWYFHYHNIHNRGGDIISKDQSQVTFNTAGRDRGDCSPPST